jgi:hypothetical protein
MQGKLSPRVPRRKRDYGDTLKTILAVPDSEVDAVWQMTPEERKQAQAAYQRQCEADFYNRRRERDALWLGWASSADPDKPKTWRGATSAAGRMDLYQRHVFAAQGGERVADADYD